MSATPLKKQFYGNPQSEKAVIAWVTLLGGEASYDSSTHGLWIKGAGDEPLWIGNHEIIVFANGRFSRETGEEVKEFTSKVNAISWDGTPSSHEKIVSWLSDTAVEVGEISWEDDSFIIYNNGWGSTVRPDCWLVLSEEGEVEVMRNGDFKKLYGGGNHE